MFCLSCHWTPQSPVHQCVESILKYHPMEKVVIVDSDSSDKSYYEKYDGDDRVIILDGVNQYRHPGSYEVIYERFPNEPYYVIIHDSIIFKKSIQKFLKSPNEFYSFMYFRETTQSEEDRHISWYRNIFNETKYIPPEPYTTIRAAFGHISVIKNSMMRKMKDGGLLAKFKTKDKWEDQNCERVLGIWAEQEGYSPEEYNIEGDFLHRYGDVMSDNLEYFTKIFLNRQ
jgi:hypothetical protein